MDFIPSFKYQENDSQLDYTLSILLMLSKSDQCTKVTDSHVIVLANSLHLIKYSDEVFQSFLYMLNHGCEQRLCNQYLIEKIIDYLMWCTANQREQVLSVLLAFCDVKQRQTQKDNVDIMLNYSKTDELKSILLDSNSKSVVILSLEWIKRLVSFERLNKRGDLKRESIVLQSPSKPTLNSPTISVSNINMNFTPEAFRSNVNMNFSPDALRSLNESSASSEQENNKEKRER